MKVTDIFKKFMLNLKLNRPQPILEQSQKRVGNEQLHSQISETIENQPGRYPLAEIAFRPTPPLGHTGFTYSFEIVIKEDKFTADFWSYNHWGILVQGHPNDYPPEIEVIEKTVELNNDSIKEDPEVGSYTVVNRVLHLPEGFRIPVGPLHFESDSLPISEGKSKAAKQRAFNIAKVAGITVNKEALETAGKMMDIRRKYPDRYFYWQPMLPDTPTKIAIDFDSINPRHMRLTLEGAPVFTETLVIPEEEY